VNTEEFVIDNDDEYEEYRRKQIEEDMEELRKINGEIPNEEEEEFYRDGHRHDDEFI